MLDWLLPRSGKSVGPTPSPNAFSPLFLGNHMDMYIPTVGSTYVNQS